MNEQSEYLEEVERFLDWSNWISPKAVILMIPTSSREERILRRIDARDRYHLLVQVEETEVNIRRRLTLESGSKRTFQLGGTYMKVVDIVAEHRGNSP